MRTLIILAGLVGLGACVDLPPERDYKYIECSNPTGVFAGVERNGKNLCTAAPSIRITTLGNVQVIQSLAVNNGGGSFNINFEMPAGGIPSSERLELIPTLARYNSTEGSGTVIDAWIVVRADEEGAIGEWEVTAMEPSGETTTFTNGVYFGSAIQQDTP